MGSLLQVLGNGSLLCKKKVLKKKYTRYSKKPESSNIISALVIHVMLLSLMLLMTLIQ